MSPHPKRHIDQFGRFSTAHAHNQETNRLTQTDRTSTVTIGHIGYVLVPENLLRVAAAGSPRSQLLSS